MKPSFYLLTLLLFISCRKEIKLPEFFIPTITAEVDGKVRSSSAEAYFSNGMLHIDTWDGLFGIDMHLEKWTEGTYLLGMNQYNEATVYPILPNDIQGSTNVDESTGGKIIITEYNSKDSTISGAFEFNALSTRGLTTVKNGKFERIKINKMDNSVLYKASFSKGNTDITFNKCYGQLDSLNKLRCGGSKYHIASEGFAIAVPISDFNKGKQKLDTIWNGRTEFVYQNLNLQTQIFYKVSEGSYEILKLDTLNKIAHIKFDVKLNGFFGEKLDFTNGFIEVNYTKL